MNILGVDTSGDGLSLALGRTAERTVERRIRTRRSDERLFPELKRLLKRAGLSLSELNAVAAACGPGRFTGIRIGMTFARMLAASLDIPAVAVNRFEAWAAVSGDEPETAKPPSYKCVVLPAGRGDMFMQVFKTDGKGRCRPVRAPEFVGKGELENSLTRVCGREKAAVFRYDFDEKDFPGFPARFLIPAAREFLGRKRLPPFRPQYLRPANYELLRER